MIPQFQNCPPTAGTMVSFGKKKLCLSKNYITGLYKKICIQLLLLGCFLGCLVTSVHAQQPVPNDTSGLAKQKDVIDIIKKIFKTDKKKDDSFRLKKKFQFSLIPVTGSVAGGGRAVATAFNASFYTGNDST